MDSAAIGRPVGGRRFGRPCAILNPRAASGRAGRRWPGLRPIFEAVLGPVDVRFTEAPNHATALAREAIRNGAELVVAVGGDGTFNEVVNGYLSRGSPINPNASLGLCPLGTGGDFKISARIPASPQEAVKAIASNPLRKFDACQVRLAGPDGATVERCFANVTSFGMGGVVSLAAKSNFLTAVDGRAAFLWATAVTFFRFRPTQVRLNLDGEVPGRHVRVLQVAIGNGSHQGGGMNMCPLAELDSGHIDVTVIEQTSIPSFLRSIPLLYSGKIYSHPKCRHYRVRAVEATSDDPVLAEVDGEAIGQLPLAAKVLPGVLSVAGTGIRTLSRYSMQPRAGD